MYHNKRESSKLSFGQMVLCRCEDWCEEGFQVAKWNGKEFEFGGQPNDMFDGLVTEFMCLDTDGNPEDL